MRDLAKDTTYTKVEPNVLKSSHPWKEHFQPFLLFNAHLWVLQDVTINQCYGSMKFRRASRSGSADLYLWLMDPDADPDSAIFVRDLQDVNKNNFVFKVFLLITFWRYIYIIFQRQKVIKKSQNSRNKCFSYYFCVMIEGFRPGSENLNNVSGSGRPINIWILGIRIRNTPINVNIHTHTVKDKTGLECLPIRRRRTETSRTGPPLCGAGSFGYIIFLQYRTPRYSV